MEEQVTNSGNGGRYIVLVVVIISTLFFAAFTNPSPDDFLDYLMNEIREQSEEQPELVSWLTSLAADVYLQQATSRSNYTLFSIYTLHGDKGATVRFIGVFGQFIPISSPGS